MERKGGRVTKIQQMYSLKCPEVFRTSFSPYITILFNRMIVSIPKVQKCLYYPQHSHYSKMKGFGGIPAIPLDSTPRTARAWRKPYESW